MCDCDIVGGKLSAEHDYVSGCVMFYCDSFIMQVAILHIVFMVSSTPELEWQQLELVIPYLSGGEATLCNSA